MGLSFLNKSKKSRIGFDVSPEGITGTIIKRENGKTSLLKYAFVPFGQEVIQNGIIVNHEAFVKTLAKFSGEHDFDAEIVNIAVPSNVVFIKTITLPNLPHDELKIIVPQEAAKHIPFHVNEANIDFEILKNSKKQDSSNTEVDILLVVLAKNIAKGYVDAINSAEFNAIAIDIGSFAAIRTLENAGYIDNTDSLFLSVLIGYENTDINIIHKGMPLFSYNIPIGKKNVIDAVIASLESDFPKIEKLISEIELAIPGLETTSDPILGRASNSVRTVYNNISSEILKILEFYSSQMPEQSQVSKIILAGPGVCVQNIDKYISNRVRIDTVICNPLNNIEHNLDLAQDLLYPINAPALATSVGLALKG